MIYMLSLIGLLFVRAALGYDSPCDGVHTPSSPEGQLAKLDTSELQSFCSVFNELRTTSYENNIKKIEKLFSVYAFAVRDGGFGLDYYKADAAFTCMYRYFCADRSTNSLTVCIYAKRFVIVHPYWFKEEWFEIDKLKMEVKDTFYDLLLLHPAMQTCAVEINKTPATNDAKGRLLSGLFGPNAKEYAKILQQYGILENRIRLDCNKKDKLDRTFCDALPGFVSLVNVFGSVSDESKDSAKWIAFQLYFVLMKDNFPHLFGDDVSPSTEQCNDIIVKNLEQIFLHISSARLDKLKEMFEVIPGLKEIRPECENLWSLPSRKKNSCLFWKSIVQMRAYLQTLKVPKHGKINKLLNTKTDYPEFLRLTEMKKILDVVQNNANALPDLSKWVTAEVNKNTNERFKGLRTYFTKVGEFNRLKAKADVDFLNKRLDCYKTDVDTTITNLNERLEDIMITAISAVTTDIAEDTIKLSLAIASACNPLKKLLGGGSISEPMEKAAELAQSLARIAKLVKLKSSFVALKSHIESIGIRFQACSDFLTNLKCLIDSVGSELALDKFEEKKQKFLADYTTFDPKVKRTELAYLAKSWEVLIDAACDVISSTDGIGSAAAKAYEGSKGHCSMAKALAAKLSETYTEIYDFQFELIEAMAANMRAVTSQYAAKDIVSDYEELGQNKGTDVANDYKVLSLVSFMSYKINIWEITEAYCDILEYKEGGNRPAVCKGMNSDIAALASYVSPTCRNTDAYKDVPIAANSVTGKINIADLYSGRDVTFQIPNADWLVKNNWISPQDKNSAIFVKKVQVFLPSQSITKRIVRNEAKAVGENKITVSSDTNYVIVPSKEFIFEYLEGNSGEACKTQTMNNPYGASLPKLCPLNIEENNCQELLQKTPLFPSVYSRWKISVTGYESTPVPKPVNDDFKLKLGVKLCILSPKSRDQKTNRAMKSPERKKILKDQERPACPKTKYWSTKASACVRCPKGSKPQLDGYFCEKNLNNMT